LVEQLIRNQQVTGSSPVVGSLVKQAFRLWSNFLLGPFCYPRGLLQPSEAEMDAPDTACQLESGSEQPALNLTDANFRGPDVHCFFLTNVAVAVRVKVGVPPPVTVKRYVPWCVERLTVMFSVEELPGAGLGVKLSVAPEGRPLMDKVTGELNPPVRAIVTV
jgi:hypothetical protein